MGFKFVGVFAGSKSLERDGKTKNYVLFIVGADPYRFSVPQSVYDTVADHALGDIAEVQGISATAFNGHVYYSATDIVWGV